MHATAYLRFPIFNHTGNIYFEAQYEKSRSNQSTAKPHQNIRHFKMPHPYLNLYQYVQKITKNVIA